LNHYRKPHGWCTLVVLVFWLVGLVLGLPAVEGAGTSQSTVVVARIDDLAVDAGLARYLERAFGRAQELGADAVILEITTLGGFVKDALRIQDTIEAAEVPVVAFVLERAWSAGALITLAADHVVMAPGSSIGAAEPRPADAKTISALRAQFEGAAERHGRDPKVAAAMVDAKVEIQGLVEQGELLTLTAEEARRVGYADLVTADRQRILNYLGLQGARIEEVLPTGAERLATFLTHPVVAPILLTLGFIGLVLEFFLPGFGVFGITGLVFLGLFFGGHLVAGFAGWEVVALFLLGLVLLVFEIFVPGFGVFGFGGILAIMASVFLVSGSVEQGIRSLAVSFSATVVVTAFAARYAAKRGFFTRFALNLKQRRESGYVAPAAARELLGKEGKAISPLRPAGVAEIGMARVDVVSEGGFVSPGTRVRVIRVEGSRVVVRPVDDGPDRGR